MIIEIIRKFGIWNLDIAKIRFLHPFCNFALVYFILHLEFSAKGRLLEWLQVGNPIFIDGFGADHWAANLSGCTWRGFILFEVLNTAWAAGSAIWGAQRGTRPMCRSVPFNPSLSSVCATVSASDCPSVCLVHSVRPNLWLLSLINPNKEHWFISI